MESAKRRQTAMTSILTKPVVGPNVWKRKDFDNNDSWIYHLQPLSLQEISEALENVKDLELKDITRENFPLPTFSSELLEIVEELERGRGFVLIRGLDIDNYTDKEVEKIYWGIGTHMGIGVSQNAYGDLLGHVYDQGLEYGGKGGKVRGYQTSARLPFHTDASDLVGLLCLSQGKSGGASSIVSSMAIFNEILDKYPEYLGVYFDGVLCDRKGEEGEGELPYYKMPIYSYYDGALSCRYVRSAIDQSPIKSGIPLTNTELDALDLLDSLAQSEEFNLDMDFQPGDMQFLNNYTVMHSRKKFEDHDEYNRKRHLLRLWLTIRDGRNLALGFSKKPNDHLITENGRGAITPSKTRSEEPDNYPVRK